MPLSAGTKLGSFEILSAIGAGGMGEVYKARDTRLDRIVAIKVLPAHLADRSDLRERFEREARTIASLNHPHICTLHDIGQQDGIDYLVMEYLEGETLAQRLLKGSLPLEQVLQSAIEIADALDKAHRKGVTHRDLKPGNIMLTKSGTKLLDFGLAKLKQEVAPANVQLSELPTANDPLTAEGAIVGTMQYMAPEQLEGKEVDARTDIFAFGAVVYEMATGKRAFEGKSQASLMVAILERDPVPMPSLQRMTPPMLDRIVKKCLAKEPEKRWQAASDVCDEVKWIAEGGSQVSSLPNAQARGIRPRWKEALLWGGASALLAAIVGLAVWNLKPSPLPPAQPVSRTVITLLPGQRLAGSEQPVVALSPDGSRLAYVAIQGGSQQIYLRAMGSLEARPVSGTEGAVAPFFSPDGQWLGFFAGGKLKKISVSGGSALTLGDAATPRGAGWGSPGMIAFAPTIQSALQQVSDAGGTPQPLTRLGKGENSNRWPEFLPGGKAVLFTAGTAVPGIFINTQVAVQSIGTGERRNLIQGGTLPRYAPSGHLVYAQGGSLMAVPFDPQRLTATGAAVPVVEGVLQSPVTGAAQYSFSSTGSLVYVSGGVQAGQSRLLWVNRDGAEQPLAAPAHTYQIPRLSPDGRRVAVGIVEQESHVWLYDLSRDTLARFTFEGNTNFAPVWTPDGKRIAFISNKEGPQNVFWQLADGSGGLERLTTSEHTQNPHSWSPDGQLLAFSEVNPTTGNDIWVLRISDRKAQPFLRTSFNETAPRFSPDGRWLAYVSEESGRYEIYVQPYPGPGGKWQISTEGGAEPAWNPNGRELFYRSGNKMMAADIATRPSFAPGKPRMLFEGRYVPSPATSPNYDVSPDGQRFLMLKPVEQAQAAPAQINVMLNWFEELKQKVPAGEEVMALAAGTKLGSYEVVAPIGVGGMGEVYKAHDAKLRRDVAIKVLPESFARDADRLARFRREAQLLASLNHPNIATIYNIEDSGGTTYLVMELVAGETLADRIKREGAVPVEEALTIAKQIAEALEAAHEKGIIHRDLKPANVKLTPEGKVKVLDFGLAKAFAGDASTEDIGNSPTLSMAATMQGVILGTAAYMSPEQARGKTVDKRTDIWAFGCVFCELLTGKQTFHGEDVTDILAAVVRAEPDWQALPTATPVKVRDLLRRCLQKDKAQRFRDAGDARIEIEDALAAPKDSGAMQAVPASTSKLLLAVGTVAAAVTIIAVVMAFGWWRATRPVERALVRLDVDLGPDVSLGSPQGADMIISPDGTRMVYVSQGRLFTRRLDQPTATELAGTQGAYAPFFSPDGQWVAFFTAGNLQKISVEGGSAITLCNAVIGFGGSWGEDGNIIAALSRAGGLSRIPSAGGPPTPVTDLQGGEITHRWPQILPGGKAVLFTATPTPTAFDAANIKVMSLADHSTKTLVRGGTYGRYLPSGHLLYVNRGTLFAVPFDADRLEVHGTPAPVLDQISYNAGQGSAQFDFSQTGTLIYRSGRAGGGLLTFAWLDSTGKVQPLLSKPGAYVNPALSPDGQRLAVQVTEGSDEDIWVYDWQRDTMTRVTFTGKAERPVWSPDGRYIAFLPLGEGMSVIRSDGSGKPQPLIESKNTQVPWSFTPDGKRLAFQEQSSGTSWDLWTVPLESDSAGLRAGKPEVFLQTTADEMHPFFSPDGRWMAYNSSESGTDQVYVRAFPDKGGKWQISNSGGAYPMWSRNGHELFFETSDNRIMVAAYTEKSDSFAADKPQLWSEKQIGGSLMNYALAPDGKRIIALMPVETAEAQKVQNQVIFLENFFDELRRKVPIGK